MKKYGENYTLRQDDMDVIAIYMNDEIRGSVHNDMDYNSPEDFLREYVKRDPDFEEFLNTGFSIEL